MRKENRIDQLGFTARKFSNKRDIEFVFFQSVDQALDA